MERLEVPVKRLYMRKDEHDAPVNHGPTWHFTTKAPRHHESTLVRETASTTAIPIRSRPRVSPLGTLLRPRQACERLGEGAGGARGAGVGVRGVTAGGGRGGVWQVGLGRRRVCDLPVTPGCAAKGP